MCKTINIHTVKKSFFGCSTVHPACTYRQHVPCNSNSQYYFTGDYKKDELLEASRFVRISWSNVQW